MEALAASLQGVMTDDDEEGERDGEERQHTDEEVRLLFEVNTPENFRE